MYYIRKGGSFLNTKAPYMRQELTFAKPFKMQKLIKFVYGAEHQPKFDKNLKLCEDIEVVP